MRLSAANQRQSAHVTARGSQPKKTLWRWLERIEKAYRISRVSDMKHVDVSTSTGAVKTTLYNLNVLNQLAMACIDNEKLNEVSCQFSDILSVL